MQYQYILLDQLKDLDNITIDRTVIHQFSHPIALETNNICEPKGTKVLTTEQTNLHGK